MEDRCVYTHTHTELISRIKNYRPIKKNNRLNRHFTKDDI